MGCALGEIEGGSDGFEVNGASDGDVVGIDIVG